MEYFGSFGKAETVVLQQTNLSFEIKKLLNN